ncbi:glycosyltransferase [Sulfitobacter sp. JBTF-M27]|uniref:Glycosyltransferase n=1 Tax=Sulfitobacter sediminilitoris TaxID=2698830 RepID=A0A6P0C8U2_9RHOB|nr:glycosyltransferase [Sulfitobacter sediminilitoris]NEK21605.1 glycosyltransferase [Sulfitobacter sediminilitoris]
MTEMPVSIVVVSRDRPGALRRCLIGLSQVQYSPFEVIVVADPGGLQSASDLAFADDLKLVPFDKANISAARNLGITHAAGEIVAFIDDDAVPEPQWLRYLIAPAAQGDVAAMGGFVRGRNGISFQWKARSLDRFGASHPLEVHASQATVLHPPKGRAVKTEGTNMAFRRNVLIQLGGFDPAYHYYLDETDLNMRLAQAGHATALVPLAEVHHGFAANALRNKNRVPRDLFDIGASWAVFQRKHIVDTERPLHWRKVRTEERQRLLRHMVSGGLEPGDVRRLMKRLDLGYVEGGKRPIAPVKFASHPSEPFKPFPALSRSSVVVKSRPARNARNMAAARERVKNGEIVTVISLSPNALYHKVMFHEDGFWMQYGGLFGKSDRNQPLFRMTTRSRRIEKEIRRVARQRGLREDL